MDLAEKSTRMHGIIGVMAAAVAKEAASAGSPAPGGLLAGLWGRLWPPQMKHLKIWGVLAAACLAVVGVLVRSKRSKELQDNETRRKLACFGELTKLLFVERQRVAKMEVQTAFDAKDVKALTAAIKEGDDASIELGDGPKQLLELGLDAEDGDPIVDEAIQLAAANGLAPLQSLLPVAKKAKGAAALIQKILDAATAVNKARGSADSRAAGIGVSAAELEKFEKEAKEAIKEAEETPPEDKADDKDKDKDEDEDKGEKEDKSAEQLEEEGAKGRPSAATIYATLYNEAEKLTSHEFLLTGQQLPKAAGAEDSSASLAHTSTNTMAQTQHYYSSEEITEALTAASKLFAEALRYEIRHGLLQTEQYFDMKGHVKSPAEKTHKGVKINPLYRSGLNLTSVCKLAETSAKELKHTTADLAAVAAAADTAEPLLKVVKKHHGSAYSSLLEILMRDRTTLILTGIATIISAGPVALLITLKTRAASLSTINNPSIFRTTMLGIAIQAMLQLVMDAMGRIPKAMISIRFKTNLKEEVFKAVMRQDTEYFHKYNSSEILQRINEDTNTFAEQAMAIPFDMVQISSNLFFNAVGLYTIVPKQLFMVSVPVMAVVGFSKFKLIQKLIELWIKSNNVRRQTDSRVGELLTAKAFETIRSLGKEHEEAKRNRRDLYRVAELESDFQKKLQCFWSFMCPMEAPGMILSYVVGASLVRAGTLEPVALSTAVEMCFLTSWRIFELLMRYNDLGKALEPAARLAELLSARNKIETATWCEQPEGEITTFRPNPEECPALLTRGGGANGDLKGEIEFKDVDFYYPTRPESKILDKLSWKCGKGDHIAFCGKTGCGKSTSIALIQRFFEMSAGEILIDNKPIQHYDVNFLRSQIGSVGQEPVLFAKSIRDNLLYGCEESVGEEVLIDACVKANAWEFISKLPQKLDTLVGPAGMQLSGGQKQRVAIARAVLHDPKILLLDEATSALDNKSEGVVQEALDELMKGRTSFTVAHRLSTIRNSTCIYLVDAGKVVESGTYDELIQKNGEFTSLAAAGGDETAASIGKDADLEEVTKKELKKKLHKVLDTLRSEGGAVEKTEMEKMAKQLLGMVATVDREREQLRQVGEAYAKLAGENVDLLGDKEEGGHKVSFKAVGKTILKLSAARRMAASKSNDEKEEEEATLERQVTKETDQGLSQQLSTASTSN